MNPNPHFDLDCGVKILNLSRRTHIMGILNVTPDSFSDGGVYFDKHKAVARAIKMEKEGADIIDIGGESTRPGSDSVPAEEEMRRIVPVIQVLRDQLSIPISIDTTKAEVAEAALNAGANLVNDISGLRFDRNMAKTVSRFKIPLILMHIKGSPKSMQKNPHYSNLIGEIKDYLKESIRIAVEAGIRRENIVLDPGIGFGKKWEDNYIILKRLKEFHTLGHPLLVGVSRKSFIGRLLNVPEDQRLAGTAAAVAVSILNGAQILRVHDVKEMVQAARVIDKIIQIEE